MRVKLLTGLVAGLLLISLPSQAHTPDEATQWVNDWLERVEMSGGLTQELRLELINYQDRHNLRANNDENGVNAKSTIKDTGDVEQWRPLVEYWFPSEAVDTMMCLMWYESKGVPTAENPDSTATGLFQILYSLWADDFGATKRSDFHDPNFNIRSAAGIYAQQGFYAWSPYNAGNCRK